VNRDARRPRTGPPITPSASIRAMSGTSRERSTRRTIGNARTTRAACSSPDASPKRDGKRTMKERGLLVWSPAIVGGRSTVPRADRSAVVAGGHPSTEGPTPVPVVHEPRRGAPARSDASEARTEARRDSQGRALCARCPRRRARARERAVQDERRRPLRRTARQDHQREPRRKRLGGHVQQ